HTPPSARSQIGPPRRTATEGSTEASTSGRVVPLAGDIGVVCTTMICPAPTPAQPPTRTLLLDHAGQPAISPVQPANVSVMPSALVEAGAWTRAVRAIGTQGTPISPRIEASAAILGKNEERPAPTPMVNAGRARCGGGAGGGGSARLDGGAGGGGAG